MRTEMKRAFTLKALLALLIIALGLTLTTCFSEEGEEPTPTPLGGGGATAAISLSAAPDSIPADGVSSLAITAELRDSTGGAVTQGTSVSFSTNLGVFPNGNTTYTSSTSDDTGVVTVSVRAGATPGTADITSQSNNVTQLIQVKFTSYTIKLTADPASIPADGVSSATITAEVTDAYGNPVPSGTSVDFFTTLGRFQNGATVYAAETPDETGIVSVYLIAGTTSGEAVVTAQSHSVTKTVKVLFTPGGEVVADIGWINLTANPSRITANGTSSSVIRAELKMNTGDPVPTGTRIAFSTNLGRFSVGSDNYTTVTPNDTGIVTVTLISSTEAGTATVSAKSGEVETSVSVEFVTQEDIIPPASSLSLSLSQATVKSDNSNSSTITAVVMDSNNAVIEGVTVSFTTDGGQLSTASAVTDENGEAETVFRSGTTDKSNRIVTITASVTGLASKTIPVQVVGTTLTLSTDASILETGVAGNNTATLTILARDAGTLPIYDAELTVTASPARVQLTPTTGRTDVTGKLYVQVTALTAGTVVVTAAGLGATGTQNYTIGAVGSVFTIIHPTTDPYSWNTAATMATTGPQTDISFTNNPAPTQDTINRGAGFAGFIPGDRIMVVGSASNDGTYTIDTVAAGSLTLEASDQLTYEPAGASVTVTTGVLVRVNAPAPITVVQFATTLGTWDGGAGKILTKSVDLITHHVEAVLISGNAGTANISVSDADNSSTSDGTTVLFSAPSSQAAKIALQANKTVVAPSTGGTKNSVTLKATVKNNFDQVVGGAPVAFSIENPTGGGEYVSPPIVYTGPDGVAEATFTSGSLSTDSEGVTVYANVVISSPITTGPQTDISFNDNDPAQDTIDWVTANFIGLGFSDDDQIAVAGSADNDGFYTTDTVAPNTLTLVASDQLTTEGAGASVTITYAIWDSIQIVIGGAAGSVVITTGTTITGINHETMYELPMSVQVADSNGNPMTNTIVSLSVWPLRYATGCWVQDPVSKEWAPGNCDASCNTYMFYPNEDDFYEIGDPRYRNLILDPGEDIGPPGTNHSAPPCSIPWPNPDGQLTPPNSAAGTVPGTVTTDENGVASFNLVYGKASAAWIEDAITATTLVYGTETKGTYTFVLPWKAGEEESLPHSPYNFAW